jgi:hypothetical protein
MKYKFSATFYLFTNKKNNIKYNICMHTYNNITFLISVKNMNLLSSSIYKHLKTNLIKYKQSLILWECGSQLISVLSNKLRKV